MLIYSPEISRCAMMLSLLACAAGCASARGPVGIRDGQFPPCPPSPNCVCSDAGTGPHAIAPLSFTGKPTEAWETLHQVIRAMPRTRVIISNQDYLHAEFRTMIFRFVDDVECHLRPADGVIAVRSASRLGYSDFGVNRRRAERIRVLFQEARR